VNKFCYTYTHRPLTAGATGQNPTAAPQSRQAFTHPYLQRLPRCVGCQNVLYILKYPTAAPQSRTPTAHPYFQHLSPYVGCQNYNLTEEIGAICRMSEGMVCPVTFCEHRLSQCVGCQNYNLTEETGAICRMSE